MYTTENPVMSQRQILVSKEMKEWDKNLNSMQWILVELQRSVKIMPIIYHFHYTSHTYVHMYILDSVHVLIHYKLLLYVKSKGV